MSCDARSISTAVLSFLAVAAAAGAQDSTARANDPRVNLRGGWMNAAEAAKNMRLVSHTNRQGAFVDTVNIGNFGVANSDLAFRGNYVFQGNYNGFQIWDISSPDHPTLRSSMVCTGGQGDPSVYGNLVFISVEERRARVDCGDSGVADSVSKDRFRGVRIFDISDVDHPRQVASVQTCRGSHPHTLVPDPRDSRNLYVYVSGTSSVRSPNELAGCSGGKPEDDKATSLFRIDIIKVPLASPQDARIVGSPRIFADAKGNIAGLWRGGAHGDGTQNTAETNMCHDITVYPEMGLAAGACSGNGILLDIHNPASPRRITEVMDPNFAYWHSATFNNDATTLLYTDEWGGGTSPRCRDSDKLTWGADAIFKLHGKKKLTLAGYYKLPAFQQPTENCVAHNGSLVPVPGRDIMVQAWYQGGISVLDFTDPTHPAEIAYFDRGPMDPDKLALGGFWSAYWYNGNIVGSEIGRGLDVLQLTPSDLLSQNEIDAARLVTYDQFNAQVQPHIVWPASFSVSRAYLDQLNRNSGISSDRSAAIARALDAAEGMTGATRSAALLKAGAMIDRNMASAKDKARVKALAASVRKLAAAKS